VIKVRLGKRKKEENLRPLSEQEIQEKLYGGIHRELLEEGGATETDGREGRPSNLLIAPPKKKKASLWPKIGKSVWSALKFFLRTLFNFMSAVWGKLSTRWGASILAVGLVFFAIHSLNVYRASAMKRTPKPPVKVSAVRERAVPPAPAPVEPAAIPPADLKQTVLTEPPSTKKPAAPLLPSAKAYVIQICSYAREEDAQRLTNDMVQRNLPAFYDRVDRGSGKAFYLVFLGRFTSFQEAQAKLDEFRKDPVAKDFADSFVRSL
jgi:cell division septation protein DedD